MTRELRVPPPPSSGATERRQPRNQARRAGSYQRIGTRRPTLWLAALVVALGIVLCGLLLVVAPSLLGTGIDGRINLLLLGIDRRGGTGWAYRTDTIMVATLDPDTRAAGILSIPRDLQLTIPGHGQDRINTANVYGSLQDNPDGGPALLEATIEANFAIPIDGYLMVDFRAFEQIVDTLGGIEIQVPNWLHDTRYPDPKPEDPFAYKTIHFEPGLQHMDGSKALEYARSRMSTSDFDRAKRQQLVLLAIREKALSLNAIPRWPKLAAVAIDSIRTDLETHELLALALWAARLDTSKLKQVVLEHPFVFSHRRADGAAVQLPQWDLINPVIVDLFSSQVVQ